MIDKIFEKVQQLSDVLKTFDENGRKKEDEPELMTAMLLIIKELSTILSETRSEA